MLLRGRNGTELELHLVAYQFPHERVDPWDSNSLFVSVRVLTPQGSWAVVDPCLTTWEAGHLVRWLATLAVQPDVVGGRLAEPNVTLTATVEPGDDEDEIRVRASFALELRPPWLGSGDLTVETVVDRAQLARAAYDLGGDLSRFPLRGDDPTL